MQHTSAGGAALADLKAKQQASAFAAGNGGGNGVGGGRGSGDGAMMEAASLMNANVWRGVPTPAAKNQVLQCVAVCCSVLQCVLQCVLQVYGGVCQHRQQRIRCCSVL